MKYPFIFAPQSSSKKNRPLLNLLPEYRSKVQFIDYMKVVERCRWKNCTVTGKHRSRSVNRWKAQTLLNTICSFPG